MLRPSYLVVCFLTAVIPATSWASGNAQVLRNKNNPQTVWVFKNADALRRFSKVASAAVYDDPYLPARHHRAAKSRSWAGATEPLLSELSTAKRWGAKALFQRETWDVNNRWSWDWRVATLI
jgi:hypothetical protein